MTRKSFFFSEKDEITGQLAILLKICQVSRDSAIGDLSRGTKKEIIFLRLPLPRPVGPLLLLSIIHPSVPYFLEISATKFIIFL